MPRDLLGGLFGAEVRHAAAAASADPAALPVAERRLVAKAVAGRRTEFAQGRVLARTLLAELGLETEALLRDDDRVPIWPTGAVGSISHTKGCVAVAVAPSATVRGLGLDVEPATPLEAELRERVCAPAERRWLAGFEEARAGQLGKAFFSVKEAVYKACFPELRERWGFHDLAVSLEPDAGVFVATPREGALAGRALAGQVEQRAGYWLAAFTWRAGPAAGRP